MYEQEPKKVDNVIFNRRNIDIRKKWITRDLYDLYLVELAREEQEKKLAPDEKPYFGDGMSFGPMKEVGCWKNGRPVLQAFSIRKPKISGKIAIVPVGFYYPGCGVGVETFGFQLTKTSAGWLIDDIDYGEKGTLRKDLQRIH